MADIAAVNWNEVDASNSAAAPDGAPENMASSGVNNTMRAMMGATKRLRNHLSPKTTAGSASAFSLTYDVPPGALYDGATHLVEFHAVNAAGATLNVNLLGAAPLHYYAAGAWRLVPAGLVSANQVFRVMYNTAAGAYRILRDRDDTGEVVAFAGATAPAGSLLCYGQAISRTDYAGLFASLSTAHGVGDGTATFNLPDLRGRVAAGKGDMGGTESGRLNAQVASVLGAAGGGQTHTLTAEELANHRHTADGTALFVTRTTGDNAWIQIPEESGGHQLFYRTNTSATGSGTAHNNVQPTMTLNYVIRI